MRKVRCPNCGQTLFYARSADVEIKCTRCKNVINVKIEENRVSRTAEK